MAFLELKNVFKSYKSNNKVTPVLNNINLKIEKGEFVAIVGFSGSGKTTLISAIAGLIKPDKGTILKEGKEVTCPGPDRGVVFQSYSLLPWLTVYGNVALAVDQVYKSWTPAKKKERIEQYIEMVNLTPAVDKRPAELSGGMRQRVSVARALAVSPDILLLDEPLSALDALTRANLQDEIERIWRQEKKTVVLITNDVDEGILLADRIIPLNPGPDATLGPEFCVNLLRPRDRAMMNHDIKYKKIRARITRYLLSAGKQQNATSSNNALDLPGVLPNTNVQFQSNLTGKTIKPSSARDKKFVEFWRVSKEYPTSKGPAVIVEDFNLYIKKGEFISIIGHSGCGKSTVLSMAAGLSDLSNGGIILDNKEVTTAGPDRGIVFQSPSLFPWMTAFENVHLGVLQVFPHATKQQRNEIVEYYIEKVGLSMSLHKKTSEMSSGMRQRVGIARAFALSPKLLLLDEPFGMLDSLTRMELQELLMDVWRRTKVTAIMVTHDVDEAIRLSDRVVMMTNGPRAKVGKILDIDIERPRLRETLLEHSNYYKYRETMIRFLKDCDKEKEQEDEEEYENELEYGEVMS